MMKVRNRIFAVIAFCFVGFAGVSIAPLYATPTQEDVFKSISDNVGEKQDSGQFLAILAAIAAISILVAVFSKRRERVAVPKVLNNRGKLLKEVMRGTSLRPAEVRLLKALAESQSVDNPLVMLLCPSVLESALRQKGAKLERKVAIQLARKVGLIPSRAK
jgi:hypothetical protein